MCIRDRGTTLLVIVAAKRGQGRAETTRTVGLKLCLRVDVTHDHLVTEGLEIVLRINGVPGGMIGVPPIQIDIDVELAVPTLVNMGRCEGPVSYTHLRAHETP